MTSTENHLSYTTQSEGHFGDQCILFQHLWIHIKLNKTTNWVINVKNHEVWKPWVDFFFSGFSQVFFFFCPSFQSGQQKRENFTWMCFHRFFFFQGHFCGTNEKTFSLSSAQEKEIPLAPTQKFLFTRSTHNYFFHVWNQWKNFFNEEWFLFL